MARVVHGALMALELLALVLLAGIPFFNGRGVASRVCASEPATVRMTLEPGQDSVVDQIDHVRVYYSSYEDNVMSSKQAMSIKWDAHSSHGVFMFELPIGAYAFRADFHVKPGCEPLAAVPKVKDITLNGEPLRSEHVDTLVLPELNAVAIRYRPQYVLNGYLPYCILLLGSVWVVLCILGCWLVKKFGGGRGE